MDVLKQLLHHSSTMYYVRHPLIEEALCPILQYADDTLIFINASPAAVCAVRNTLVEFELAIGLSINYHKTTFLPMGLSTDDAHTLATSLGADVASFPQPYLGLPLSLHKLSVADCQLVIASCDRHLSGWKAFLLNRVGRLTLASVVLSLVGLHLRHRQPTLDVAGSSTAMRCPGSLSPIVPLNREYSLLLI